MLEFIHSEYVLSSPHQAQGVQVSSNSLGKTMTRAMRSFVMGGGEVLQTEGMTHTKSREPEQEGKRR